MGCAVTEAEDFWELVGRMAATRQMGELERAARVIERGNAALEGLPPEGEWQS